MGSFTAAFRAASDNAAPGTNDADKFAAGWDPPELRDALDDSRDIVITGVEDDASGGTTQSELMASAESAAQATVVLVPTVTDAAVGDATFVSSIGPIKSSA